MFRFALALMVVLSSHTTWAQNSEDEISTKSLAFGLTTNNYTGLIGGVVARSAMPLTVTRSKTIYQYLAVEAIHLKNPREYAQYYGFTKFIAGKRNYFFTVRPEYGREVTFFQRSKESNIGLSYIYAIGPSIGFLKPYTVKYQNIDGYIQYDPNIRGSIENVGGMFKNGFRGMKITPGVHAKLAANIDINTFNDNVSGLEIGSTVETFFKKPEILASTFSDNPQTFVSVYLTLYFGNKKIVQPKKTKKSGNGID